VIKDLFDFAIINEPFKSFDDLLKVKVIYPKTLEKLKLKITL